MRKWIWFISLAVVISIVAFRVGRRQDCKISLYYTALSPDAQKSATLYTKQCGAVKAGVAEKEYLVVVMRPVSEPPPIGNRFAESDVNTHTRRALPHDAFVQIFAAPGSRKDHSCGASRARS
jgi:hypothetical protein